MPAARCADYDEQPSAEYRNRPGSSTSISRFFQFLAELSDAQLASGECLRRGMNE
jgi:hypothetical protein